MVLQGVPQLSGVGREIARQQRGLSNVTRRIQSQMTSQVSHLKGHMERKQAQADDRDIKEQVAIIKRNQVREDPIKEENCLCAGGFAKGHGAAAQR